MDLRAANKFLSEAVDALVEAKMTPLKKAKRAISSLFGSGWFKWKVNVKDLKFMLSSVAWRKKYGRVALAKAWEELKKDGFVKLKKDKWVWQ